MVDQQKANLYFKTKFGRPLTKFERHVVIEVGFGLVKRFANMAWVEKKYGCMSAD